jgi:hypothetical protein
MDKGAAGPQENGHALGCRGKLGGVNTRLAWLTSIPLVPLLNKRASLLSHRSANTYCRPHSYPWAADRDCPPTMTFRSVIAL